MGEQFFLSLQQNIKLFFWLPILCAIFRAAFIVGYHPYQKLDDKWAIIRKCFSFGFWWGMDVNAYQLLILFFVATIPGLFIVGYAYTAALIVNTIVSILVYAAFAGKLIFYKHFNDTYNYMVHYGNHADKKNLIDIFFNQDKGAYVLLGILPVGIMSYGGSWVLSKIPNIPYPYFESSIVEGISAFGFLLLYVLIYYWFHFGGTLNHRNKPEWDTVPTIVKEDIFFAKATIDDLEALKLVRKNPLQPEQIKSDEELMQEIDSIMPDSTWRQLNNPLEAFKRTAKGSRISGPHHIFLIVGESIPQWSMDPLYMSLNICPGLRAFASDAHTVCVPNFLPAGNVSRPSISSLMSGVYDSGMELNEKETFWNHTLPTALPAQMKKLGYQTIYWYGGNSSSGNFTKYGKAQGFDRIENAVDFCGSDAPRTWLGVYDHVFLEKTAELILDIHEPTFHFVYTTTNHGPYKLEDKYLDFDATRDLRGVGNDILNRKNLNKELATYKYCDKAIFDFVTRMKKKFPDSLFIVTGDHSSLFGELHNTSFLRRDYTVRERFNTVFYMQHPELLQSSFTAVTGTHLSLIPTLIEAVAPKGFGYYSVLPSLFEQQPDVQVTPYQWITENMVGDIREDYGQLNEYTAETAEYIRPVDSHQKEANAWRSLAVWLMNHYAKLDRGDNNGNTVSHYSGQK